MNYCKHPMVQNFKFPDGEPAPLWNCLECSHKFVPLDLEMEKDAARFRFERENRFQWFEPKRHWRLTTATGKVVHEGSAETYESAVDMAIWASDAAGAT